MTNLSLDAVSLASAVPEAIVLVVERPLVGKRRHETVDVPGRAGSWLFTEEPGDRIISVDLDLQGATFDDRRDAVRRLADWCDLGAVAPLIVDDETDRYHEVLLEHDPDPAEWLVRATITLRFRAGPYALAVATTTETITVNDAHFDGTITLPDDVAAEPVIEIDPPVGGYIGSFSITINGDTLSVFGPVDDKFPINETITVSSISDTVLIGANADVNLTGAFDPTDTMVDARGRFPMLEPGVNTVSFQSETTADPITLRIIWRRRFR